MRYVKHFWSLSKKERALHLLAWGSLLLLVNIPDSAIVFGPFHSEDFSLILPSIYGLLFKAFLFYATSGEIALADLEDIWPKVKETFLLCLLITLIESLLDSVYYTLYFWSLDVDVFYEIVMAELLITFVFFYLPAIMFGFIRSWKKSDAENTYDAFTIEISDGLTKFSVPHYRLTHVESLGNKCIYHAGEKYTIYHTLEEAQSKLPKFFLKCHDAYLINAQLIQGYTENELLVGGFIIPFDQKYREELGAYLR